MVEESFLKIIECLAGNEGFIQIASEIFKRVNAEIKTDFVKLYQVNGDKADCIVSEPVENSLQNEYELSELTEEIGKKENNLLFPIFIRGQVAMYVLGHKEGISKSDISTIMEITLLVQNVAANKNFNDSLETSYKVLENTINLIPVGIAILDQKEKNILLTNSVAQQSNAVQNAIGIGLGEHLRSGRELINEIYEPESGLWFDVQFTDINWINGEKVLISTAIDITTKIKEQQKIEYQANNDYLTGLFNRMKCERDLRDIIATAVKKKEKGIVIFLDLDNFKQVNDGLGHQYGDVLLQEIAINLQEMPEINNCCYRMGGDEFVIVVKPEQFGHITEIVDKISKRFNEPWQIMDVEYYCTMSMGLAIFPDQGNSVDQITKKADYAMYEAKKSGKNRYLWYSEEFEQANADKNEFENSIKDLVGNKMQDFEIHYQPVMDKEGNLYGAEALVRIVNKELGKLMPAEFLPVAEYLGIMNKIGNFVFEEACGTLAEWNRTLPKLKLFVNMAPTQLMVSKAANQIMDMVDRAGCNLTNVYCEVSEKNTYRDEQTALSTMEILSAHGLNISLDDFGGGRISLDFLKKSKANFIKYDSSFTRKKENDILMSVALMAKTNNIKTAFVGIENDSDRSEAVNAGADFLEGFYYGPALPKEDFEKKWIMKG